MSGGARVIPLWPGTVTQPVSESVSERGTQRPVNLLIKGITSVEELEAVLLGLLEELRRQSA